MSQALFDTKSGASSTFCQSLSMIFIQNVCVSGTETAWYTVERLELISRLMKKAKDPLEIVTELDCWDEEERMSV